MEARTLATWPIWPGLPLGLCSSYLPELWAVDARSIILRISIVNFCHICAEASSSFLGCSEVSLKNMHISVGFLLLTQTYCILPSNKEMSMIDSKAGDEKSRHCGTVLFLLSLE